MSIQNNQPTIIRWSQAWWVYMFTHGGILRATVNGVEDALAITGRTLLLIYLVYCGAKAGAFLVAPDFKFDVWLEMGMFVLQLGGLEGSIPGLARRAKVLREAQDEEAAEKVGKVMLSARILTIASMAEGALHSLGIAGDTMKYISAGLLVVRGVVITGFLIELAKMDSIGPRILSRDEHAREEQAEREASAQAQVIADLQSRLESEHEQGESLRAELEGMPEILQTLEQEQSEVQSLRIQLGTAAVEVDTLRAQLESREQQLESLKGTMSSGMKWHESNTELAVSSVQSQLEVERKQVESLQEQLMAEKQRVSSVEAELGGERRTISSLRIQLEAARKQMADMQEDFSNGQGDVSALRRQLHNTNLQIQDLTTKLEAANSRVEDLQKSKNLQEGNLQNADAQTATLSAKLQERERELAGAHADLQTAKAQVSDLQNAILYPCLRVEIIKVKREIMGSIPPGLMSPLGMKPLNLKVKSHICASMACKAKSLTNFSSQLAIDTL